MTDNRKHVYVDIDSLYDTRITLLGLLNMRHSQEVLRGDYLVRRKDSFGHLTANVFKHIYRDRDNTVLELSEITNMVKLISGTMLDMNYESMAISGYGDCKLFVNVYPYDLTDEEIEILRETLMVKVKNANNIIILREESISSDWIDTNIKVAIMYDGLEWLNNKVNCGELEMSGLVETKLIVPNIFPTEEEVTEEEVEKIYSLFGTLVELAIVDSYYFSLRPPTKTQE